MGKKQPNCSLDRLTLLGNFDKRHLESFLNNSVYVESRGFAKYPYRDNYKLIDGGLLQLAEIGSEINVPPVRIDFNPNSAQEPYLSTLLDCFHNLRPSRVDIAIDYWQDLQPYYWISKGVKRNIWTDAAGHVETLYIGAPNAEKRIRIYNKAVELKDPSQAPYWRVEQQNRLKEGEGMAEQFCGLHAVLEPHSLPDVTLQERALLHYLVTTNNWGQVNPRTRKKYKAMLDQCEPLSQQPKAIWAQEKTSILTQILAYTGFIAA